MQLLLPAGIAAGAAIYAAGRAARLTMANARELQDLERRADEESLAALLCADLQSKLVDLVLVLPEVKRPSLIFFLEQTATSTSVLEAVLPKLGALGPRKAYALISAVNRIPNLVRLARFGGNEQPLDELVQQVIDAARHIGVALDMLLRQYQLERPIPLEKTLPNLDLEKLGLKKLKEMGF